MNIVLSGASSYLSYAVTDLWRQIILRAKCVLYVSFAIEDKKDINSTYYFFQKALEEYPDVTCDLLEFPQKLSLATLKTYDLVYLEDGNALLLKERLQLTCFEQTLKTYANEGGILWGAGAGAVVLGSSLAPMVHLEHNSHTNLLKGLNLVKGYDVWCHYQAKKDDGFIDAYPGKLLILADDSAAYIEKDRMTMVGTGCMIYQKRVPVLEEV